MSPNGNMNLCFNLWIIASLPSLRSGLNISNQSFCFKLKFIPSFSCEILRFLLTYFFTLSWAERFVCKSFVNFCVDKVYDLECDWPYDKDFDEAEVGPGAPAPPVTTEPRVLLILFFLSWLLRSWVVNDCYIYLYPVVVYLPLTSDFSSMDPSFYSFSILAKKT